MLPDLPKWPLAGGGARAGWALNKIMDRIRRQALIGSATVTVSDTDRGQLVSFVGAGGGASLDLGFAVSNTGASITVAAGKVVSSSWGSISATDPKPSDWTVETNFTGGILASTSAAVWLQVQFATVDYDSEGVLGTEVIDISGGAGGRGGGGGGGGASNGDTALYTAEAGTSGQAGIDGGAGGAGGRVLDLTPAPIGASGEGAGANGGTGGAGGDGGVGSSVTFTRKTKAVMARRRWTISSLSVHATKGTPSDTAAWIKLATISGGDVTQHVLGTVNVSPPVLSFIED